MKITCIIFLNFFSSYIRYIHNDPIYTFSQQKAARADILGRLISFVIPGTSERRQQHRELSLLDRAEVSCVCKLLIADPCGFLPRSRRTTRHAVSTQGHQYLHRRPVDVVLTSCSFDPASRVKLPQISELPVRRQNEKDSGCV
jgi:hypothetical protein